jgi:hypothetical protein
MVRRIQALAASAALMLMPLAGSPARAGTSPGEVMYWAYNICVNSHLPQVRAGWKARGERIAEGAFCSCYAEGSATFQPAGNFMTHDQEVRVWAHCLEKAQY